LIAFARGKTSRLGVTYRLFLVRPDGTGRQQLTAGWAQNPSWSPDSRPIAFDDGQDIYTINSDGSGLRRLTSTRAVDSDPAWSPEGRVIAFVRAKPTAPPLSGDIWVMDVTGHRGRMLIRNARQPAWKGR
jgi:Tol biopolymer transport system component